MVEDTGLTYQTEDKVKRWEDAKRRMKSLQDDLNSAGTELANATNELGKFLTPKDAKIGEVFQIWNKNQLLQVEVREGNSFTIGVRGERRNGI